MSGRTTILEAENQTPSTGLVLAAFQTAAVGSAASNVRLKRIEISQNGSTTLSPIRGDVSTRTTAGTLTTTSLAPNVIRPVGSAASGLAGSTSVIGGTGRSGVISTADSGGTYTTIFPFNFPNTAGYLWKPDPDEEIWIPPSTVCVVRFLATPTPTGNWTFSVWLVEE